MQRRLLPDSALESILQPETALESAILDVPAFRQGMLWGQPRFGHPEGAVAYHVREVLDNISLIPNLATADRQNLRLIALAHDAFKYAEDHVRPRDWSKHHGIMARRFMEQYTQESIVLDVVEMHDDAYYCWLYKHRDPCPRPLSQLLGKLGSRLQLYYLFFKCDTQTGDKTQGPLHWFEQEVKDISVVKIKPFWPWEKL
jgi:hypothetical protein